MTTSTKPALAEQFTTTNGDQLHNGQTRTEIFTDGSCIGNPGHGGYGIVTLRLDSNNVILKRREASGYELETTNIQMEMTAACVALESLGCVTAEPIWLFCDANLIPNAMNEWLANWKAKDWRKSDGKLVVNRVLWERLEAAAKGRNVKWRWVRSHDGAEHNERADKLAYAASRKAEAKLRGL
jgi:ribonuclease HI